MSSLVLQYIVVALAVIVSAVVVMQKQFPGAVRRLRTVSALWLLREQRAPSLRRLGHKLAPAASATAPGCGGCSGCDD
jgi:hypothetical protein